ncbi:MAG: nucleotidyl transferase AbiEii/AbiGii toxin family protein [Candidatus Omnitrophota bacterium]
MAREILSPAQKKFISLFSENKGLKEKFYLTGGTALSAYYLHHRYSEDLDFFSLSQIEILGIDVFLKEIKPVLKIKKIDFQQSFNRNIYFLHIEKDVLKTEFTYFPFEHIEKPAKKDNIYIDSALDIAANKAFTIYQNPRARDFIDLYYIILKYPHLSLRKLLKMARIKFDSIIDPIQLGAQLLKAQDMRDLPRMLQKIDHQKWRVFFLNEAKNASDSIFKSN